MNNEKGLALVIVYLMVVLAGLIFSTIQLLNSINTNSEIILVLSCLVIGGYGGILYCLRGAYLNYCVRNQWSNKWIPWYLIRPVVSMICGGVSYVFLKAGLLILESTKEQNATNLGFYALSFIAGMNVDKFIAKIEDLAQATWGIEKSRSSQSDNK